MTSSCQAPKCRYPSFPQTQSYRKEPPFPHYNRRSGRESNSGRLNSSPSSYRLSPNYALLEYDVIRLITGIEHLEVVEHPLLNEVPYHAHVHRDEGCAVLYHARVAGVLKYEGSGKKE
jgi:hypothetical protein